MEVKKELAGKRFGKLFVLEFIPETTNKRVSWLCRCDCGVEKKVRQSLLKEGGHASCGCRSHVKGSTNANWKGYGEIGQTLWYQIKRSSKRRSRTLEFEITIEDAWELFLKQDRKCALSGVELSFVENNASLDRIDSDKGYTKENIQWTHKLVNTMKWNLRQEEFLRFCKLITENKKLI